MSARDAIVALCRRQITAAQCAALLAAAGVPAQTARALIEAATKNIRGAA